MFWRSFLLGGGWGGKLAFFAVLGDLVPLRGGSIRSGGVWAGGLMLLCPPEVFVLVFVFVPRGYNKEEKRSTMPMMAK